MVLSLVVCGLVVSSLVVCGLWSAVFDVPRFMEDFAKVKEALIRLLNLQT